MSQISEVSITEGLRGGCQVRTEEEATLHVRTEEEATLPPKNQKRGVWEEVCMVAVKYHHSYGTSLLRKCYVLWQKRRQRYQPRMRRTKHVGGGLRGGWLELFF